MSRVLIVSFLVGALAATALPQENDRPEPRGERRRGPNMDRMEWTERMLERVVDDLELDDDQRARFEEIMADQRQRMQESRERWREVREAMRAGDTERAERLRAELRDARGPDSVMLAALDELEPVLRDDQVAKLWEIQDRMQRRQADRDARLSVMRDLPDELGLDDEQRAEFDRLLTKQRQQMRERMRGQWSEMQPLVEELREATEAGDEQRIEELRKQIEDARPSPESMFDGFFEELETILTEEQVKRLAEFRQKMEGGGRDQARGPADVRDVLRSVRRLDLGPEQKDEIRVIEREAIGAYRKIGRKDKDEQARLATHVKQQILEVLDEGQKENFEKELQRLGRRGRGPRVP